MQENHNHTFPKVKICISGAAETSHCGEAAFQTARELGREVVRHGAALVDGATTGFPHWAAKGAKEEGGIVVGFSPASSERDHIENYALPVDFHDIIVYLGTGFSMRNLLLTRAADAVVVGCGRMGTINEFTIAFEDRKPIGILRGDWETDEVFSTLLEKSHRAAEMKDKIVFNPDPKKLLDELMEVIRREKEKIAKK